MVFIDIALARFSDVVVEGVGIGFIGMKFVGCC
jgi:hypothetical protein